MFLIYFYSSYTSKSYKDYTLCFSSMCLLNGSKISSLYTSIKEALAGEYTPGAAYEKVHNAPIFGGKEGGWEQTVNMSSKAFEALAGFEITGGTDAWIERGKKDFKYIDEHANLVTAGVAGAVSGVALLPIHAALTATTSIVGGYSQGGILGAVANLFAGLVKSFQYPYYNAKAAVERVQQELAGTYQPPRENFHLMKEDAREAGQAKLITWITGEKKLDTDTNKLINWITSKSSLTSPPPAATVSKSTSHNGESQNWSHVNSYEAPQKSVVPPSTFSTIPIVREKAAAPRAAPSFQPTSVQQAPARQSVITARREVHRPTQANNAILHTENKEENLREGPTRRR
jgi:hypothetical protein